MKTYALPSGHEPPWDDFMRGKKDRPLSKSCWPQRRRQTLVSVQLYLTRAGEPCSLAMGQGNKARSRHDTHQVRCPMLILFGADDPMVPTKRSAELLRDLTNKKANLTYGLSRGPIMRWP
jgi:pimeloyl-ACP methyl ester carboxylesterase